MIPIASIDLGDEEERLVLEVMRSGRLSQGAMVERFEASFAKTVGTKHAIAVSSGTAALILALQALRLKAGEEVITSPFTFAATLASILHAGGTARFVDITEDDYAIDPTAFESAITKKTRAILPVHLYGQGAAVDALKAIADKSGLALIEDAAQSHGATVEGNPVGSFGTGCFSFYATKNLTTGEGGMITTNENEAAATMRVLRNQGMKSRYEYVAVGNNYRLTDLQAAIGVAQLQRLQAVTEVRQRNATRLTEGLSKIPGVVVPSILAGRVHVFHQYTVRITKEARLDRDSLATELGRMGIETGIYYPRPVFDYECFRSHPRVVVEPMPRAESASREVLSVPVHPRLKANDLDRIVDSVRTLQGAE